MCLASTATFSVSLSTHSMHSMTQSLPHPLSLPPEYTSGSCASSLVHSSYKHSIWGGASPILLQARLSSGQVICSQLPFWHLTFTHPSDSSRKSPSAAPCILLSVDARMIYTGSAPQYAWVLAERGRDVVLRGVVTDLDRGPRLVN
jgi:hypothetical protein